MVAPADSRQAGCPHSRGSEPLPRLLGLSGGLLRAAVSGESQRVKAGCALKKWKGWREAWAETRCPQEERVGTTIPRALLRKHDDLQPGFSSARLHGGAQRDRPCPLLPEWHSAVPPWQPAKCLVPCTPSSSKTGALMPSATGCRQGTDPQELQESFCGLGPWLSLVTQRSPWAPRQEGPLCDQA